MSTRAGLLAGFAIFSNALVFKTSQLIASFDDIQLVRKTGAIPQPYAGIEWSNFVATSPAYESISSTEGIAPVSPPAYALSAPSKIEHQELPSISRSKINPIAFFDLQKFSWGCLAVENSKACNCSLTISCYEVDQDWTKLQYHSTIKTNQDSVARRIGPRNTRAYHFHVSPILRIRAAHMQTVRLDGRFNGCQKVTFEVQPFAEDKHRSIGLVVDDVTIRTYHVTEWDWKGLGHLVHQNGPFGIA